MAGLTEAGLKDAVVQEPSRADDRSRPDRCRPFGGDERHAQGAVLDPGGTALHDELGRTRIGLFHVLVVGHRLKWHRTFGGRSIRSPSVCWRPATTLDLPDLIVEQAEVRDEVAIVAREQAFGRVQVIRVFR